MIIDFILKHRLKIGLILLLLGAIVLGIAVYTSLSQSGKTQVSIVAVPRDAHITLNGQTVGAGDVYLQPGTYDIKATKEGFADFTDKQVITTTKKTLIISLSPVSNEAQTWLKDHEDEYLALEGIAGRVAQDEGETFLAANPITSLLPFSNLLYTIGYSADPADPTGTSIILQIDASEPYRQSAIYQIYQWGYDPTDFRINFNTYTNPFAL